MNNIWTKPVELHQGQGRWSSYLFNRKQFGFLILARLFQLIESDQINETLIQLIIFIHLFKLLMTQKRETIESIFLRQNK